MLSGAGAPGKFLKVDLLRLNLEPFQVFMSDTIRSAVATYIVTLIFIYIAFQYTPCS